MTVGLIVFVLYLYYFVGINDIIYTLERVNTGQYLLFFSLAFGSMLLAFFFWTAAWRTMLQTLSINLSIRKAFMIFWVGYFFDLIIPSQTIGSEVTRLYLVRNETKGNLASIAASAIANRIVEYSIVATGLFISVAAILSTGALPSIVSGFLTLVLIGVLVYLAILLFLAFEKRAAAIIVSIGFKLLRFLRLKKYQSTDAEENTRKSLNTFYGCFGTFRKNPRTLVKPFIFQLLSFLFNLAVYILAFMALGIYNLSFGFFVLTFFIASSIQGATASLSVGSLDIILLTVFTLYGVVSGISGVAVIVLRSVTYWFPLLLSYALVQVYGLRKIRNIRSKGKTKPVLSKERESASCGHSTQNKIVTKKNHISRASINGQN